MLKIALTGNIASGKSTLLEAFVRSNFKTLCLDATVNMLYEKNVQFKAILIDNFQTSDKKEIAKIVLSDTKQLKKLEKLIYPFILNQIQLFFVENKTENFVIVDAPMLFEYGMENLFDKVIFVSCDEKLRLNRLVKRNCIAENEAQHRIDLQEKEDKKLLKSDYIIYNNSDLNEFNNNINRLIKDLALL